jgi:hypothetical protein
LGGYRNNLSPIGYLTGFKTDFFHAGMYYDKRVAHYRTPTKEEIVAGVDQDSFTSLTPDFMSEDISKSVLGSVSVKQPVGFAYPGIQNDDIKALLKSCGKCHNWAQITLYEISADKFFSSCMVLFLRWDAWLIYLISVVNHVTSPSDAFVDFFVAGLVAYDVSNIRYTRLVHNSEQRRLKAVNKLKGALASVEKSKENTKTSREAEYMIIQEDVLKLTIFIGVLFVYSSWMASRTVFFQFSVLIALCVCVCSVMTLVYNGRWNWERASRLVGF